MVDRERIQRFLHELADSGNFSNFTPEKPVKVISGNHYTNTNDEHETDSDEDDES